MGAMVVNELLMQFQAAILNVPVIRPKAIATTALGGEACAAAHPRQGAVALGLCGNSDCRAAGGRVPGGAARAVAGGGVRPEETLERRRQFNFRRTE